MLKTDSVVPDIVEPIFELVKKDLKAVEAHLAQDEFVSGMMRSSKLWKGKEVICFSLFIYSRTWTEDKFLNR